MKHLTPNLRGKLVRFHEAYEAAHARLLGAVSEGAGTEAWEEAVAAQAWNEALRLSPLTEQELRTYKMHVAIYLANGGELFSAGDEKGSE